jgi:autotransporter-associated beta strand protein
MKPKSHLKSFLMLSGGTLLGVSSVNATQFWDGTAGGGDNNWNTPANWGGDALPAFTTTAINFGSLSSVAGTAFGNVVVPAVTTTNNNLTAGTLIVGINFGNNGQANRTDAYTLQGNSIAFGNATNQTIGTTALHAAAIVSSIEDVITLDIDLGSPVGAQNRQFQALAKHYLKFDGVISGGANAGVLVRVTDSKVTFTNANNSYLGFTNISEGTASALESVLEITSIANGGSNSSIGASSNAAGNLRFNSGFNDTSMTTLRYIGSTNASTDRLFTLYGNINGTNSRIESSGDGTLSFTNTGAIASGHARGRNFYLGGTNTGDNTFAPTLSDFNVTELSTFTKQGAGKWIITGNHTYTGATTVSEGTLLINGSTAALSTVDVASGATLGGTGIINGVVNVTGQLSPGASIATLATGALSMLNGSTLIHELNSSVADSVGSDLLTVNGNLNLTGTVNLTLTDLALIDTAFDYNDVFSLVNYTGTWNGGLFTLGGNELADEEIFTVGLNSWRISYNDTVGGFNYDNEYVAGSFVNLTAIPEPSTALLGGLGLLTLLRRRR